jgi:plastocyanin
MGMQRLGVTAALAASITIATMIPAAAVTIRGSGSQWSPSRVSIDRGDRVRWRAVSGAHTVRAYGGNWTFSERINAGESVSHRFRRSGTFRFFCSIHGDVSGGDCTGMCGRVRV